MTASNLKPCITIATLIKVRVYDGPTVDNRLLRTLRIQNWCNEDYFYRQERYKFLNFDGGTTSSEQLDFANSGATTTLGNPDPKVDSIAPIRQWLRQEDGWRRARIEVVTLNPEDLEYPIRRESLQVLSSSITDVITLDQRGAAEAVNCLIPSTILSREIAPELPLANAQQVFLA